MEGQTFKHRLHLEPGPSPQNCDPRSGRALFVGTATVIVEWAGLRFMTDPNFLHKGEHVHLGPGIVSERLTDPAVNLEDVGPVDFVLLSHFHEDYFDKLVQEKLYRAVPILTTPQAAEELSKIGFLAAIAVETWQTALVTKGDAKLLISSMPAQHAPTGLGFALPDTMGSIVTFVWSHEARGQADLDSMLAEDVMRSAVFRMLFSGDTLLVDQLREIPKRYPHRIDVAFHYNDYDVFKSSLDDFVAEAQREGLEQDSEIELVYLKHGDVYGFTTTA
ncbi:hypothetical protein DFJ74DRAFT_698375 [Hyaloraphidium curvatum]|nr:hypothetical protein DFJ74DRAFT_698375 [Hyaloraphidium curvatum]